jgi:HEAT repeat protein
MRLLHSGGNAPHDAAIVALGYLGRGRPQPAVRELLLGYAEGADHALAEAALTALSLVGDSASVPRLVRLVAQRTDHARQRQAAQVLGNLGSSTEAARALRDLLQHASDPWVRAEAAWALGKHAHAGADALPALESALSSDSPAVRANAVAALYRLDRAPPRLLPLLDDADPAVRGNAALALAHCAAARTALARLQDSDPHPPVRTVAARVLGGVGRLPQDDWLALSATDFDGTVLGAVPYRLTLADGLVKLGVTDALGRITEVGVPRGPTSFEIDGASP